MKVQRHSYDEMNIIKVPILSLNLFRLIFSKKSFGFGKLNASSLNFVVVIFQKSTITRRLRVVYSLVMEMNVEEGLINMTEPVVELADSSQNTFYFW